MKPSRARPSVASKPPIITSFNPSDTPLYEPAMNRTIRLGISTCPNDTFAFHALLAGAVSSRGLSFEISLLDIEDLNRALFRGEFDVAKTSFHAALHLAPSTLVLRVGAALGFGVGPLLLAAAPDTRPTAPHQKTLCPGEHTTATLLFELFYPQTTRIEQVLFSDIMPRLEDRTGDFGVCIHEGRFTWQDRGLSLVEDLGTRWEQESGHPLPLGGLVARRELGSELIETVEAVIGDSLDFALADPSSALPSMRRYAQEFDDEVLMKHVELYVNDWTRDLGIVGEEALAELSRRAQSVGRVTSGDSLIEVFRGHA